MVIAADSFGGSLIGAVRERSGHKSNLASDQHKAGQEE